MSARTRMPLAVLAALAIAVPVSAQVEEQAPPQQEGLIQALENEGRFSTFVELVRTAGLEESLAQGEHTIFAPTDEAFQSLPEGRLDELKANPEQLRQVVQSHIVPQSLQSMSITEEAQRVMTLAGTEIEVIREGETIRVQPAPGPAAEMMGEVETAATSATVETADLTATGGVIHAIDTVLLPAS